LVRADAGHAQPPQLHRQRALAVLGHRVLPRPAEVARDGLEHRALLLLLQLAPLLGERALRHRRALQRPLGVFDDLDRRHLDARAEL
jgi:hypothetical protein